MDTNWTLYLTIVIILLLGGVLYDRLVAWLHRTDRERGLTAFLVVGGTLFTLAGAWVLYGTGVFVGVLGLFAASGLPMVVGSWVRYTDDRAKDAATAAEISERLLNVAVDDVKETG